jgi:hypothetical protein
MSRHLTTSSARLIWLDYQAVRHNFIPFENIFLATPNALTMAIAVSINAILGPRHLPSPPA